MRVIGTLTMFLGGCLLAVGLFLMLSGVTVGLRDHQGARAFADGQTLALIGGVLALAGVLLRGLADMLDEVRGLRADLARQPAPAQSVADAPFLERGRLPPKPDWTAPPLPARIDMVARHGEQLGGTAWDIMRRTRKAGSMATEADALRLARLDLGLPHG